MIKKVNLRNVTVYFALHIGLALAMASMHLIATIHAYVTLLISLFFSMRSNSPTRVMYCACYIVACELLWRMNFAPYLFYEYGKYATILTVSIFTIRRGARKPLLPLLYMLALIPGIIAVSYDDWSVFRREISFNLSGPFALFACLMFFSKVYITREDLHKIFLMMIGPIMGISAIAARYITTAKKLSFTEHSNFITSGGFGPNQVSAALGLGAFLAIFFVLDNRSSRYLRAMLAIIGIGLAAQSALTFSRGGVYNLGVSLIVAIFFLIKTARMRRRIIGTLIVVFVITNFFVIPKLISFTQGTIQKRFESTETTGRKELMEDDLELFKRNPIFGIGAGKSSTSRLSFNMKIAAHTEFTRLLSEHGVFGIAAILALMGLTYRFIFSSKDPLQRAFSASFIAWAFVYMTSAAMRLTMPSLLIGLAGARLIMPSVSGPNPVVPQENVSPGPLI